MKQLELFPQYQDNSEDKPKPKAHGKTCNNCKFAVAYNSGGSKNSWYCTKQKSRRTDIGLKKIKARNEACTLFKLID